MKQHFEQCAHVQDGKQCRRRVYKAGERFCITHDIQIVLARGALAKVTAKHSRTCTYWVFSGDRHCSCERDKARGELENIQALVRE